MAKYFALTLLMVALVLCSSLSSHARPDQTFARVKSFHSGNGVTKEEPLEPVKATTENEEIGCDEKMNEEECLLRRTLVAHTDYIYTQDNHN